MALITTVHFNFTLDESVGTPFGQRGIVTMLGFDEGGVKYYVVTETGGNWFKERQLTK